MEPRVRYISFFEEMEFVVRKDRFFPSFKMPFLTLSVEELPVERDIAFLIVIDNLNPQKEYQLKIVLEDQNNERIFVKEDTIEKEEKINSTEGTLMISFQQTASFKEKGDYTLKVYLDEKIIGKESFVVIKKVKKDEEESNSNR